MGITVDHIIGKRWFTVNFEVFLLRICHVLWPSKGHVFFFKPQHLDVLKILNVTCKILKYTNHNFFFSFWTDFHVLSWHHNLLGTGNSEQWLWKKTFLSPNYCLCCSALENRLYCLRAKMCLSLGTYIFVHINLFFQLSLRGLHCHIAVITEFTNF